LVKNIISNKFVPANNQLKFRKCELKIGEAKLAGVKGVNKKMKNKE